MRSANSSKKNVGEFPLKSGQIASQVGGWIGETHRAEDYIESTPESGRVFFFSDEKVFKVDAAAPGHQFSHIFLWENGAT